MKKVAVLLSLSLFLYGTDRLGWLEKPKGLLENLLKPISLRIAFPVRDEVKSLREQNVELLSKITDQTKLQLENEALRAQLDTKTKHNFLSRQKFLPAKVLGQSFNFLLIDKGTTDSLRVGQTIVYKNILVGKVISVSQKRARVELPFASASKIPAKTERAALGIVVGQGTAMVLDNVTLLEQVEEKDLVFTAGTVDGLLPDILIGQVSRVFKTESALFQQASLESPLDFKKLEVVFAVL